MEIVGSNPTNGASNRTAYNSCFAYFVCIRVRRWLNQAGSRVTDASLSICALESRKSINHLSVVKRCSPTAGGVGDIRSLHGTVTCLGIITVQLLG